MSQTPPAREQARAEPALGLSKPTGLAPVDRALGRWPQTGPVVYVHDGTLDASPYILHAVHAALSRGERVVVASHERTPSDLGQEGTRLGYGLIGEALVMVSLRDHGTLKAMGERLRSTVRAHDPALVAVAGITRVLLAGDEASVRSWWDDLRTCADQRFVLCDVGERALDEPARHTLRPPAAILRILRRDVRGARVEGIQIEEAPQPRTASFFPTRIDRPGGPRVHVPKLLVTGPHNSGKSTFVHTITGYSVSVERLGTTVAMDHGRVERDGIDVDVFGTPGQERFGPVIHQVAAGAWGVLLVVDSTRPSTFHRAKAMAHEATGGVVPIVVAANKQDVSGARPPDEIRAALGLPADTPALGCVATDAARCRAALDALLDRIFAAPPAP